MVHVDHIDMVIATEFASLFFIGITVGRFANGFLAMRLPDPVMIRIGQAVLLIGIALLLLPAPGDWSTLTGFVVIGLGCAPIYPCVIHSTPTYFGEDKSQAIVGVQMAFAYVGSMLMPALFGLLGQHISMRLLPWYLLAFTALMIVMHETLRRKLPVTFTVR